MMYRSCQETHARQLYGARMRAAAASLVCLLAVGGCGGGSGSGSDSDTTDAAQPLSDDPVENTLMSLGVPMEPRDSAAMDSEGEALPDTYEPLGARFEVSKPMEFLYAGGPLGGSTDDAAFFERTPNPDDPPDPETVTSVLDTPSPREWNAPDYDRPYDAVAADIDADGLDETVVAFVNAVGAVVIYSIDDAEGGYAESSDLVSPAGVVGDLHSIDIEAGDFDYDGYSDIAIAAGGTGGTGYIVFVAGTPAGLELRPADTRMYTAPGTFPVRLLLSSGNTDYDNASELAVAFNVEDIDPTLGSQGSGTVSVEILEREDGAWVRSFELAPVSAELDVNEDGAPEQVDAIFARAVLADIDADELAELVIVGLNAFLPDNSRTNDDPRREPAYMLLAYEDGPRGYFALEPGRREFRFEDNNQAARQVRYVHVQPVDLDGDEHDELAVNEIVFDNFADTATPWQTYCTINTEVILPSGFDYPLAASNTASAVGDFTDDDVGNIAYVAPQVPPLGESSVISVISDRVAEQCQVVDEIPIEDLSTASQNAMPQSINYVNILLMPVNLDDDGVILRTVPGQHQLIYTEPMLVAALAAPPCAPDIGQNVGSCSTAYGSTVTIDKSHSASLTVFGSLVFGGKGQSGVLNTEASVKAKVSAHVTASQGVSASRSESIVFTGGPMEDTVIFSAVPYDVYEMIYLRNATEPTLVGTATQLLLPRPPVSMMVEKDFYNSVVPEEDRIGADIFQHTIGDLSSYPTEAERDALMEANDVVLDRTTGTTKPWLPPTRTDSAVHVGQGGGSVQLGLAIGQAATQSISGGVSVEVEVEGVVVGVLSGFSVGIGVEKGFSRTYGEEMSYTGSVGNLDADHFYDDGYSFGLFTYNAQHSNGQVLEVVNYWVDPD